MESNPIVVKLESEVHTLQKDMAQIGVLVDRLDVTIEKLTEVSTTVSRLLAVQENRLEYQEKLSDKLQTSIESQKAETNQVVKEIYTKINDVEIDLSKDIEKNQEKIIKKIEELKSEGGRQHNEINERMTSLEKWMWILMGGGVVIAFIIQAINLENLF
jgi:chromosome segregation ATPase